ncbi:MAG TPA: TIM-barrel domain-containing protein [Longimicrobiaceae bacterium]|nr:TIM-barrel domain-containing protein [Longimicrobiaceae bacterium]
MTLPTGASARPLALLSMTLLLLGGILPADAQVRRITVESQGRYLALEALDDDLVHFEVAAGRAPAPGTPIRTSIMVEKTDYAGATAVSSTATVLETPELRITVEPSTLCFTATERARRTPLTTVCPRDLERDEKGLTLTRERTRNLYGLGEQFLRPGDADGDWMGRERTPGNEYGNRMTDFGGGQVGNAIFPILYALGDSGVSYALFLDQVYRQHWDFRGDPWRVRTRGDGIRGYLLAGSDLPELRRDYLELVGTPPVPPRKAFGLWVSEYGYDDWGELEGKLRSLRANAFPVDGFVLDLLWYGGIATGSDLTRMGSLTWDERKFPDPAGTMTRLREEEGVGLMLIEQSYVGRGLPEHDTLANRGFLARQRENGPPTYLTRNPWWGKGGMIDWTDDVAGDFWHDWKRQPLVEMGVFGQWTDLGEPEAYDSTSWYHGVVPGRHAHADIHNLYNLKWSESIVRGYRRHGVRRRPFVLARSGTSGIQRYGVALWSGDIGSNLPSLAAHLNAQMHMSLSGVDYFGSDIGGFHRGAIRGDSLNEMYTQWFANGALLDVPVRAHAENLCNCKETAPDRIGDLRSNRANLRLRYELSPYYYSLAHRARLYGEPLFAPPVFYHRDDPNVRTMGHEKLVGRDLLVGIVARHGETRRDVYLPRGRWIDYHANTWHTSRGEWIRNVPVYREGIFRLPLYARAGAIIPKMHVDERTMNILGRRTDGTVRDELVVRVYPDPQESRFFLYEDDGESVDYLSGAVAITTLSQRRSDGSAFVGIGDTKGSYEGAPARRNNVVELVLDGAPVRSVTVNGRVLRRHSTREEFESAGSGWFDAGSSMVVAKSGVLPVSEPKSFEFSTVDGDS